VDVETSRVAVDDPAAGAPWLHAPPMRTTQTGTGDGAPRATPRRPGVKSTGRPDALDRVVAIPRPPSATITLRPPRPPRRAGTGACERPPAGDAVATSGATKQRGGGRVPPGDEPAGDGAKTASAALRRRGGGREPSVAPRHATRCTSSLPPPAPWKGRRRPAAHVYREDPLNVECDGKHEARSSLKVPLHRMPRRMPPHHTGEKRLRPAP
jgi:hypothetical protein